MSETLDLKSKHLWRLVETFTKPKDENEDDEEDARDSNTPDWVARAMLEDLQMLSADHAALVARIAELEAQLAAARPDQVAAQMAALADNDAESRHMDGDALLCATLRALGYGDAVDEFVRWMKWYA